MHQIGCRSVHIAIFPGSKLPSTSSQHSAAQRPPFLPPRNVPRIYHKTLTTTWIDVLVSGCGQHAAWSRDGDLARLNDPAFGPLGTYHSWRIGSDRYERQRYRRSDRCPQPCHTVIIPIFSGAELEVRTSGVWNGDSDPDWPNSSCPLVSMDRPIHSTPRT